MDFIGGPIIRYIFLSVFALLLLTACGGSETDTSSNDSINVFENTTGARVAVDKESTANGETRQKTEDVVKLDTGPTILEDGAITTVVRVYDEVEHNVVKLKETNTCVKCNLYQADLSGANLNEANLSGARLTDANLTDADLTGANLTGAVLRADLSGANLTDADLRGADLRWAVLSQGDLSGANLTGADLYGADLTDAINADFTGAINVP
jgi:uncharacterized protein YjbI with pentapeptide repeats